MKWLRSLLFVCAFAVTASAETPCEDTGILADCTRKVVCCMGCDQETGTQLCHEQWYYYVWEPTGCMGPPSTWGGWFIQGCIFQAITVDEPIASDAETGEPIDPYAYWP